MAMGLQHYPPSVKEVPRGLTVPGFRYWLYSVVTLTSLFLFLLFYLGLIVGAAYLVYLSLTYEIGRFSRGALVLKIASIVCSVMLFLFLLKGLFKRHRIDQSDFMEIHESEHPELYAFIRRLCRELRAPFPHRIFLTEEVTAGVFYDTSLLNLLVPVRKNLLIGLGLVNVVTLNEFKAVLAHEFGHFSQAGMALGTYVYVANRVVSDMVVGRDQWDEWVESWKEMDFRIAIFGWLFSGVIWVLRQVLAGVFWLMNLAHFALMRQMEFHADLMAVSVAGSDAPTHALARMELAGDALAQAMHDLSTASSQQLYSRDLYYHQARAMEYLRTARRNPKLGNPPPLPEDPTVKLQVFPPVERSGTWLWSTHPSLYARERNMKRRYIRSTEEGHSPWTLFREPELLRASLTAQFYAERLGVLSGVTLSEPEKVHAAVHGERDASAYDPRYHGLYDRRCLMPGDVAVVARAASSQPWPPQRLAQVYDRLYGGTVKGWMEEHSQREEDLRFLAGLHRGEVQLKTKEFEFRGVKRLPSEVQTLIRVVEGELEGDRRWLESLDGEVFRAHYQMALQVGGHEELLVRYQFQLRAQEIMRQMQSHLGRTHALTQFLSASSRVSEEDVRKAAGYFREASVALAEGVNSASGLQVPPLKDWPPTVTLGEFLQPGRMLPGLHPDASLPSAEWVRDLLRQMGEVHEKTQGVLQKNMGAILSLQERIAGTWRASMAAGVGRAAPSS